MRQYFAIRNRKTGELMPHYNSNSMPAIYQHLKTAQSVLRTLNKGHRGRNYGIDSNEWEAIEVDIVPSRRQLIEHEVTAGHEDY
jgi:hypothetical protein